jgi:hypothetical protein
MQSTPSKSIAQRSILPSIPKSSKWSFPFRLHTQNFVIMYFLSPPYACYKPCPSYPPWLCQLTWHWCIRNFFGFLKLNKCCLFLGTDEGDLNFDYLSNFGPRFRKLADMYGEDPSDDDDENFNTPASESWCWDITRVADHHLKYSRYLHRTDRGFIPQRQVDWDPGEAAVLLLVLKEAQVIPLYINRYTLFKKQNGYAGVRFRREFSNCLM